MGVVCHLLSLLNLSFYERNTLRMMMMSCFAQDPWSLMIQLLRSTYILKITQSLQLKMYRIEFLRENKYTEQLERVEGRKETAKTKIAMYRSETICWTVGRTVLSFSKS